MRQPSVLAIALGGLTALLASCGGGGEEAGFLAVAFRLDEGSPVMVAYAGDPTEDPFLLPAGRYYVEAMNQDEVVFSRSVVDTDGVHGVGFPPNMGTTADLAPPPAASRDVGRSTVSPGPTSTAPRETTTSF